jgi:predicted AAA+ superfamily ATPase
VTYIETNSLLEARKIQEEILQSFSNDFPKYERRADVDKLQFLFQKLPFQLGKKLIYQHLDPDAKSAEIKKAIQLFIRANIITPCYHVTAADLPLKAGIDFNILKIYFLDIGLVNCMHQFSWRDFQEMFEQSFATKGFLAEQFISQHLSYQMNPTGNPETLFWLKDKSTGKAEIDFLVSLNGKVTPIEVKAGKGGRLKSFEVFAREKNILKGYKFSNEYIHKEKIKIVKDSTTTNTCKDTYFEVENWPYYSIEGFIEKLKP